MRSPGSSSQTSPLRGDLEDPFQSHPSPPAWRVRPRRDTHIKRTISGHYWDGSRPPPVSSPRSSVTPRTLPCHWRSLNASAATAWTRLAGSTGLAQVGLEARVQDLGRHLGRVGGDRDRARRAAELEGQLADLPDERVAVRARAGRDRTPARPGRWAKNARSPSAADRAQATIAPSISSMSRMVSWVSSSSSTRRTRMPRRIGLGLVLIRR